MRTVSNQTREPNVRERFKPDPTKHYVKVETGWNGGVHEAYDRLMNELLEDGSPKYEDLGCIPGVCESSTIRVLVCSKEAYYAQATSDRVRSENSAGSGTDLAPNAKMNVTKVGPRTIDQLNSSLEMRDPD